MICNGYNSVAVHARLGFAPTAFAVIVTIIILFSTDYVNIVEKIVKKPSLLRFYGIFPIIFVFFVRFIK